MAWKGGVREEAEKGKQRRRERREEGRGEIDGQREGATEGGQRGREGDAFSCGIRMIDRAAIGIVLYLQLRGRMDKPLKTKRGAQKPFRVSSAGLGDQKDMLGQVEPETDDEQADNADDAIRGDEQVEAGDEAEDR